MAARTDSLPASLIRFFLAPAALGGWFASLFAVISSHASRPSLPRMSDEWMHSHGFGPDEDWR